MGKHSNTLPSRDYDRECSHREPRFPLAQRLGYLGLFDFAVLVAMILSKYKGMNLGSKSDVRFFYWTARKEWNGLIVIRGHPISWLMQLANYPWSKFGRTCRRKKVRNLLR